MKEYAVITEITSSDAERKMLSDAGYANPAINYYLEKKYMGHIENADQVSEKIGSCGDTMKVYLKFDDHNLIDDVRYEITGKSVKIISGVIHKRKKLFSTLF
jgi:nitrogen fixation NifU-like protein